MDYRETDNRLSNFLLSVAAIVIGGAIVYYLFWRPRQQIAMNDRTTTSMSSDIYNSQYEDLYHGISGISNRLRMLESRINDVQNAPVQANRMDQMNPSISSVPSSYKNNEKWLITRSKDGFIDNLEVIRDAKMGK